MNLWESWKRLRGRLVPRPGEVKQEPQPVEEQPAEEQPAEKEPIELKAEPAPYELGHEEQQEASASSKRKKRGSKN